MRGSRSVSVFAEQAANCPAGLSADRIVAPHARIVDAGRFFVRAAPPLSDADERLDSRRHGSTIPVLPSSGRNMCDDRRPDPASASIDQGAP